MSVNNMLFQAVVSAVAGAKKESPVNIFHTWDGWVSKNVLHVVSRSGARAKDIWHFPVDKCAGATMFFKNTTGTAYCYTRPGPKDDFEAVLRGMNPRVTIDYVSAINTEMYRYGTGCNHDTGHGSWYSVLTDGEVLVIHQAPVVESHFNQFHVGCPTGPDTLRMSGGTYAVQLEKRTGVRRVLVTPAADHDLVVAIIRAKYALNCGNPEPAFQLVAKGVKLPEAMANHQGVKTLVRELAIKKEKGVVINPSELDVFFEFEQCGGAGGGFVDAFAISIYKTAKERDRHVACWSEHRFVAEPTHLEIIRVVELARQFALERLDSVAEPNLKRLTEEELLFRLPYEARHGLTGDRVKK